MPDEAPYEHILFEVEDGVATITPTVRTR